MIIHYLSDYYFFFLCLQVFLGEIRFLFFYFVHPPRKYVHTDVYRQPLSRSAARLFVVASHRACSGTISLLVVGRQLIETKAWSVLKHLVPACIVNDVVRKLHTRLSCVQDVAGIASWQNAQPTDDQERNASRRFLLLEFYNTCVQKELSKSRLHECFNQQS